MTDVLAPKLNTVDDTYVLVEWLVDAGAAVAAGDPVAVLETSKATEEVASPAAGHLRPLVAAGAECAVGQVIAQVTAEAGAPAAGAGGAVVGDGGAPAAVVPATAAPVITDAARALMRDHGIGEQRVAALGRRVVRRADVEALLGSGSGAGSAGSASSTSSAGGMRAGDTAAADDGGRTGLGRAQRAVAAVVSESHRTIPAAFVAVKVAVGPALVLATDLRARERCMVGLTELVVKAVASLGTRFPLCFATGYDGDSVRVSQHVHVGVTMDVGTGLQVPVVRDVTALTWRETSTALMRLRTAALRGTIAAHDLAGSNIMVALHTDDGVTVAMPIVLPGHVCALALGATHHEVALAADGTVHAHETVTLGLSYDHRVLNGRTAVEFLRALKALLEAPAALAALGDPTPPKTPGEPAPTAPARAASAGDPTTEEPAR